MIIITGVCDSSGPPRISLPAPSLISGPPSPPENPYAIFIFSQKAQKEKERLDAPSEEY